MHIFGLLPNRERPRFVTFLTKYLPPSARSIAMSFTLTPPPSPVLLARAIRYSRNAKVSYRAFAVQLAQVFLEQELRERKEGKGTYLDEVEMESRKGVPAAESNVGVLPLLDILVKRASDKVATVRAKALQDLGTVLQMVDDNPTLRTDIERLLQLRPGAATATEADKTNLLSMLQRRIVDEKATVRKAAIQVLLLLLRAHTFLDVLYSRSALFFSPSSPSRRSRHWAATTTSLCSAWPSYACWPTGAATLPYRYASRLVAP